MATIFTVNYNGDYGNKYELKLDAYEDNISNVDNTSKVTAYLYLRRTDSSSSGAYNNNGTTWTITIDGTQYSGTSTWDTRNSTEFKEIGSASKIITHNSDGSKTISISGTHVGNSASGSSKMGNASGSGTFNLTTIPRYANFTEHYVSSTGLNSITVKWASDAARDYTKYSLNDGEWLDAADTVSTDNKSGVFTIYNLTPNTQYKIKTKIEREDSKLWTESGYIYGTTKDIAKISSANNFNLGDNANVSITNPASATANLVMSVGGTQILSKNLATGTNTITFTDAQLDSIYKKFGNSNSVTVSYILKTNNTYENSKTVTCSLLGNQKTAHIKVNTVWRRGKCWRNISGTWKRCVMWRNVNGTWRRCI